MVNVEDQTKIKLFNASVLDILEKIKGMDRVKDVVWSEIVNVVGRKYQFLARLLTEFNIQNHLNAIFMENVWINYV